MSGKVKAVVEQEAEMLPEAACPLVSVAIPSYNAASTLAETLESVLEQTYKNIEIIVVDDGSTDNTQEVLRAYASRVHCIRKANGGLASARNAGCLVAQGKYVALLDADDICLPERIAMQVEFMERFPEIVLCSTDFIGFNHFGEVRDSHIAKYYSQINDTPGGLAGIYEHREDVRLAGRDVDTYAGMVYEQMALGSFIHPPTVLFRRSVIDECGPFDESIVNCCDFEWFIRVSRTGNVGFLARPLLKYRFSENQMSGKRHRVRLTLDVVHVIEKTIAADPRLYLRAPKRFRRNLAIGYFDAANALVDDHPLEGIRMLKRSVALGVLHTGVLRVLFKAVTPSWLLRWKRRRLDEISPRK